MGKHIALVAFGGASAVAGGQPIDLRSPPAPDIPAAILPADGVIAALPYDGLSGSSSRGQDYEPEFDGFDLFVIEDFEIFEDARATEFRSRGFGGQPDGAEDFIVEIWSRPTDVLPGQPEYDGEMVMRSIPGGGIFEEPDMITTLGGQCLPAGRYYVLYFVRMDFGLYGSFNFFNQPGPPQVGGGEANNGWMWNPGGGWGFRDGLQRARCTDLNQFCGVNYVLSGVPANCECLADLDIDGDLDAEDFFSYLDLFASGSELADFTGDEPGVPDGVIDADDFFAYLDLFAAGCG